MWSVAGDRLGRGNRGATSERHRAPTSAGHFRAALNGSVDHLTRMGGGRGGRRHQMGTKWAGGLLRIVHWEVGQYVGWSDSVQLP
jgi:hypothetical protein